jgi:hypothetical protein
MIGRLPVAISERRAAFCSKKSSMAPAILPFSFIPGCPALVYFT